MILKNAEIFYQESFQTLDLQVYDGTIVSIASNLVGDIGEEIIDCRHKFILPGFVDIHTHGCVGYDFTTATEDEIEIMRNYYVSNGITSILATTMTIGLPTYRNAVTRIGNAIEKDTNGCHILGINMEGPFFGPEKKGAHDSQYLMSPSSEVFDELDTLSGNRIVLIDVDPTQKDALSFIQKYKSQGKYISLAHTACTYEVGCEAVAAGADHITHLFNAMNPLHHRAPGLLGVLSDHAVVAEMICDGFHIHPSVIRMMYKMEPNKLALISDSMSATGLEDGFYEIGGQKVIVKDKKATLEDGTIAGSTVTVYEAFLRILRYGIPLEQAILSATLIPARSIGIDHIIGSIELGKRADLLIMDRDLQIHQVLLAGRPIKH